VTTSLGRHFAGAFVLVLASGLAEPAWACSCMSLQPCEALWRGRDAAPTVFEATVVSIERRTDTEPLPDGGRRILSDTMVVHLTDVRTLLGEGATSIETSGSGASCGYPFKVGQRYVIDATRAAGSLSTSSCSQTTPVENAGALLAYIASLNTPSPGATVTGLVSASMNYSFSPRGRPSGVGGLTVTVDGPVSRSTRSAANGAFSFAGLPPGQYRIGVDTASSPVWEARPARPFELPNTHACHDAYVPLTLNAILEGTVVDATGKPVRNASVALRRTDALTTPRDPDFPTFVGYATTRSDALGRYEFKGLQPGEYVVGLNLDSGPTDGSPYAPTFLAGQDGQPEVIDFPLGGHRLLPQLVAVPTSAVEVTGRVQWPDGRPGAGMRVRAFAHGETRFRMGRSVDAVVDAEGRFTLMLPAGIAHSVRAFVDPGRPRTGQDDGVEAEAEIVAGRGTLTLVLRRRR
jgi:Carboxypeptidase regulatory-like domain